MLTGTGLVLPHARSSGGEEADGVVNDRVCHSMLLVMGLLWG